MRKSVSMVFETRQDSTLRLYQSMMATRYMKPRASGIYEISVAHTWLGRSIFSPLSRYGYTLCPSPGMLVLGRGYTA